MAVQLNHTIVAARDAAASARWFAEMLGLPEPQPAGHFWQVSLANGIDLDFASTQDEIRPHHYAFLISEAEFDEIHGRLLAAELELWADPGQREPGRINTRDGGRGVYFLSNDGHYLEILTRPYGSGSTSSEPR